MPAAPRHGVGKKVFIKVMGQPKNVSAPKTPTQIKVDAQLLRTDQRFTR